MKKARKIEDNYPEKSKIRIIGGFLYFIILLSIFFLLILSDVNLYVSILLILFLFLLGIGPIISGFNKKRLHNLFHRKAPQLQEIKTDQIKKFQPMTLNFEYKSSLLKKCSKCGMLLIGTTKNCPNCGNRHFD